MKTSLPVWSCGVGRDLGAAKASLDLVVGNWLLKRWVEFDDFHQITQIIISLIAHCASVSSFVIVWVCNPLEKLSISRNFNLIEEQRGDISAPSVNLSMS